MKTKRKACKFYTTRHNFEVANKTKNKCKLVYPESLRYVIVVVMSVKATMVEAFPDPSLQPIHVTYS